MAQNIVYIGKYTLENNAYSAVWVAYSIIVTQVKLVDSTVQVVYILFSVFSFESNRDIGISDYFCGFVYFSLQFQDSYFM